MDRELQKRVEQLERINIDLKTRLDETVQLYEQSQRDLRTKVTELQRTVHELDKTRELKDALARENKKLAGMSIFFLHYTQCCQVKILNGILHIHKIKTIYIKKTKFI